MPYTDDQLIERVRKALGSAKYALDETQLEVALLGVERTITNNISQWMHLFAPLIPPKFEDTKRLSEMADRNIALTQEIGRLNIENQELSQKMMHSVDYNKDLIAEVKSLTNENQRLRIVVEALENQGRFIPEPTTRTKARTVNKLSNAHRIFLEIVGDNEMTLAAIAVQGELRGIGRTSCVTRISELSNGKHFGGPLLDRTPKYSHRFVYRLNDYGRRMLGITKMGVTNGTTDTDATSQSIIGTGSDIAGTSAYGEASGH